MICLTEIDIVHLGMLIKNALDDTMLQKDERCFPLLTEVSLSLSLLYIINA